MIIATVGELIEALSRFPADMSVGTANRDYVGESFEETVSVEMDYVNSAGRINGRIDRADGECVVIR